MLETFEINGAEMTADDFANLYPPVYPEAKQLPNTGIPAWIYMAHKCTSCGTGIQVCAHNPYRVGGEIFQQKMARRAEAEAAAKQEVNSVGDEENQNAQGHQPTTRATRQKMNKELSNDDKDAVLKAFDSGRGMTELAKEFRVYPQYLSSYLKSEGRELKKGGFKKGRPAGAGKPRSTRLALDEAEFKTVLAEFDKGMGSTDLAKKYNVQQTYMSAFLKENGRVILRGKAALKRKQALQVAA